MLALVALGSVSNSPLPPLCPKLPCPVNQQHHTKSKKVRVWWSPLNCISSPTCPKATGIAFSALISGICCPFGNTWLRCYCQAVCSSGNGNSIGIGVPTPVCARKGLEINETWLLPSMQVSSEANYCKAWGHSQIWLLQNNSQDNVTWDTT